MKIVKLLSYKMKFDDVVIAVRYFLKFTAKISNYKISYVMQRILKTLKFEN